MTKKLLILSGLVVSLVFGWSALIFVYNLTVNVKETLADCPITPGGGTPRAGGLISAQNIVDFHFSNPLGICVNGSPAFIPLDAARYRVDNYAQLFARYYTQNTVGTKVKPVPGLISGGPDALLNATTQLDTGIGASRLYNYPGNLTIGASAFTGTKVALIFVTGNLIIGSDINYGDSTPGSGTKTDDSKGGGLVFIVQGQVLINAGAPRSSQVQQINAVIIAEGLSGPTTKSICTACASDGTPNYQFVSDLSNYDNQLVINGNLVALNTTRPIYFARGLYDNMIPAEVINFQPKYLVILKDVLSSTLKIWTEL